MPETLANAFIGKAKKPTQRELSFALKRSHTLWDGLVTGLKKEFALKGEWNSYSIKYGWSLRLKRGDRNIVYLVPRARSFQVAFLLGDKAVKAALASDLPAKMVKNIKTSKRYAEGTAVRLDVKTSRDVAVVKKLAAIKLEN